MRETYKARGSLGAALPLKLSFALQETFTNEKFIIFLARQQCVRRKDHTLNLICC